MLRFDDQFPLHRKVAALSDSAFRLHTEAIFWARRNLTDGFVPSEDLPVVSRVRDFVRAASEAVRREVWHRVAGGQIMADCEECKARHNAPSNGGASTASGRDRETPARRGTIALTGDGWVIHGYADWNQIRSEVLRIGEIKRRSGQAGGIASGRSRRSKAGGPSPPRSKPEADAKQSAKRSVPNKRTPSALSRAESAGRRTLPPDAPRCAQHHDQPAVGCGTCRSDTIGRE